MTVIDELTEFESDVILEEEATNEKNFAISSPENNYQSFAILAPNITIPEKRTTYWCSVHKLPDYANMVHGVGFEKSIVGKSKGLIHHMEVKQLRMNFFVLLLFFCREKRCTTQ